jgi:hypothetical protein
MKNLLNSMSTQFTLGLVIGQAKKWVYCLVCKSNHPFLALKGVTEMSFLVLKRISRNSEEDQYFIHGRSNHSFCLCIRY